MDEKKIGFLSPEFIMAAIIAVMSDFAFIFILALFIPVIGIAIALMIVVFHYFAGLFSLLLIFPKLKHLVPKLILLLSIILPWPFLCIGIVVAIILQNRFIEFIVTQVAIQTIAVATLGAGEVLEAGEIIAETGAEAASTAAAAQTAATVIETEAAAVEIGAETIETGSNAAKIAGEAGPRFQEPVNGEVPTPKESISSEKAPEEPKPEDKFEFEENKKLENRKKEISNQWNKIKDRFEEKDENNKSEESEESN